MVENPVGGNSPVVHPLESGQILSHLQFIAKAPQHNRCPVAVAFDPFADQSRPYVGKVAPTTPVSVVAPLVYEFINHKHSYSEFINHKHSYSVRHTHKRVGIGVVRAAYSIESERFKLEHQALRRSFEIGCSKRSEVMMVGHPLEEHFLPVEFESIIGRILDGAYSELVAGCIQQFSIFIQRYFHFI